LSFSFSFNRSSSGLLIEASTVPGVWLVWRRESSSEARPITTSRAPAVPGLSSLPMFFIALMTSIGSVP